MFEFLVWVFSVVAGICLYLLPTIIAAQKKHPQQYALLALNIFLGWTFLGWVVALVWALIANDEENKQ